MCNQVYRKDNFIVFPVTDGFVIHNLNKPFEEGHTHLKTFQICKTIIDLAIHKKIPRSNSDYILHSLIRLSQDAIYIDKIEQLIAVRESKGHKEKCRKKDRFDK